MTDIEVHSCLVRVVRRDGWSWGPAPHALLDSVLAAVPRLIQDALEAALPDGISGEVREPLRIRVPVRAAQLRALARSGGPEPLAELKDALTAAFQEAVLSSGELDQAPPQAAEEKVDPAPADPPGPVVLRVLLDWHRSGQLGSVLDRLPDPVLVAWHRSLLTGWRATRTASAASAADLAELVGQILGPVGGPGVHRAGGLQARMLAMTAVAAQAGLGPADPAVLAALDEHLGPDPAAATGARTMRERPIAGPGAPVTVTGAAVSAPQPVEDQPVEDQPVDDQAGYDHADPDQPHRGRSRHRPRRAVSTPVPGTGEVSALPFLVLAQLSRIGWIDALGAGVAAFELDEHWPALAAALAFTVLDEPGSGWRRSPRDRASAAAFADAPTLLSEYELPATADLLSAPLDVVLAHNLTAGHPPGDPLLLVSADPSGETTGGVVLLDGTGLFPIGWADHVDELSRWTDACPRSRVVHQSGHGPADADLIHRSERVLAGLRARPAFPLAAGSALDRSFTVAAGAALAAIGWTMWGAAEPSDPLLTLQRLRDLDAVVHRDRDGLRVVLPLGARYFALHERGLLGEVPGVVPWLGGRSVVIVGG